MNPTNFRFRALLALAVFSMVAAACSNEVESDELGASDSAADEDVGTPSGETDDADAEPDVEAGTETAEKDAPEPLDAEETYDAFMDASAEFYAGDTAALDSLATDEVIAEFVAQTDGRTIAGFRDSEVLDVTVDDDRAVIVDCVADRRVALDGTSDEAREAIGDQGRPGRGVWLTTTTTLARVDDRWVVADHDDPINAALAGEDDPYAGLGPAGFNDCERPSAVDAAVETHNSWYRALLEAQATDNDPERVRPYVNSTMYTSTVGQMQRRANAGDVLTEFDLDWGLVVVDTNPEFVSVVQCLSATTWVARAGDEVLDDDSGEEFARDVVIDLSGDDGPRVVQFQNHEGAACDEVQERPYSYPQG